MDEVLALAIKTNHDQYCGCISLTYAQEVNAEFDCPLGALLKAIFEHCSHEFGEPDPDFGVRKCKKCPKQEWIRKEGDGS